METRTPQRRFFDAALSLAHVLVKPLLVLVLLIFTKGVLAVPFIAGTIMSDADVVRRLAAYGILDQLGGRKVPPLVVKTANYTVKAPDTASNGGDASGTIFQNTGAGGAVTFTLFAPALKYVGVYYEFFGMVDQNLIVNCSGAVGRRGGERDGDDGHLLDGLAEDRRAHQGDVRRHEVDPQLRQRGRDLHARLTRSPRAAGRAARQA
jgi:hypothetical protein